MPLCRVYVQSQGWSNYGDGFTTNQSTIAMIRSYMTGKG